MVTVCRTTFLQFSLKKIHDINYFLIFISPLLVYYHFVLNSIMLVDKLTVYKDKIKTRNNSRNTNSIEYIIKIY